MDLNINSSAEDWHQPVALFLPNMTNCDDDEETFFDTRELLGGGGGGGGSAISALAQSTTAVTGGGVLPPASISVTAPSPLSGANDASLSPSGGSTTTGVTTGPLSPGAISQTSNNAGTTGSGADGVAANLVGAVAGGAAAASAAVTGTTSCCENGRPIMTDPVSGQTVCSCQYDSARLALSSYSRMPAASVGVYGTPYPSTEQNPYPSIGVDSSAFYSPLSNPYALKDSAAGSDMTAWTSAGLQPTSGYYSYDPALAAYGYGAGYDLASRRKNATRESTATLKAWLNEHKKNPYPTKGEKIMLAIITKMTLTQVSTWFANARRRLKKENKMTWEPKNKTEDDDDAMLSDDEKDAKDANESEKPESIYGAGKDSHHLKSELDKDDKPSDLNENEHKPENLIAMRSLSASYNSPYGHPGYNPYHHQQQQQQHPSYYQHQQPDSFGAPSSETNDYVASKNQLSRDCGIPIPATKPKIWSLADTVACKTPPPTTYLGQQQQQQQQYYAAHHQAQQLQHQHPQQQHHTPQHQQQLLPQQQQHQQQHQQQQHTQMEPQLPVAHNSPLNMMNSYVAGSPYSRIPTAYGHSNSSTSSNNSVFNGNSNNSSSNGMPTTPTSPPSMNSSGQQHHLHQQQQLHLQQYHQQHQQQQSRMGFPEIQPDTPPQTPPNMKLLNGNGTLTNHPLLVGPQLAAAAAAAAPTTAMCYTNGGSITNVGNSVVVSRSYGNDVASSSSASGSYASVLTSARTQEA